MGYDPKFNISPEFDPDTASSCDWHPEIDDLYQSQYSERRATQLAIT